MPHPGDEANGMCPSKAAKNRTQCVNGRNSINSVLAKVKNNKKKFLIKMFANKANFNSIFLQCFLTHSFP